MFLADKARPRLLQTAGQNSCSNSIVEPELEKNKADLAEILRTEGAILKSTKPMQRMSRNTAPVTRILHFTAIMLLSLATLSQSNSAFAQADATSNEKDPPDYAAMIEALASRNKKPEIVDGRPLFLPHFDWEDQTRVLKAFSSLRSDASEELWEELLKHLDDDRYSLTMEFNESGCGVNYSVGRLCRNLAYLRLVGCVLDCHVGAHPSVRWNKDLRPELRQWRQARADKSLYELQIEVCEMGLQNFDKLPGYFSEERKQEMRRNIELEIADLRKTKQAKFQRFSLDSFAVYGKNKSTPPKASLKRESRKAK